MMEPARLSRRVTRLQSRRRRQAVVYTIEDDEEEDEELENSGSSTDYSEGVNSGESRDEGPVVVRNEQGSSRAQSPNRADDEVNVVNGSDRESDIEFLMETDSEDGGSNVASSSARPVASGGQGTESPPSLRLSSVAQRFMARRRRRQRQIVEIDLDDSNQGGNAPNEVELDGDRIIRQDLELDSDDDEIQLIQDNTNSPPSGGNERAPIENQNEEIGQEGEDIDVVAEIIRSPDVIHVPTNSEREAANQNDENQDEDDNIPVPTSSSTISGIQEQNNERVDNDNDSEDEGPPQKMPRLETSNSDEEESCHICYERYDNSGGHRPCCLKCGHIFGMECIEKWVKLQKRCPDCNSKATPKDIRIIYFTNVKPTDVAELERLKGENDKLKIEKNRVELTNAQLRCQVQVRDQEIARIKALYEGVVPRSLKESKETFAIPEPTTSSRAMEVVASTSSAHFSGLRIPKLQIMKKIPIKEGQSRVGAHNEWMNLMVVSHAITSSLFPSGSHGIKKINCLDMKPFQSFPIHQKTIRDMAFSPSQNDLLLTVGLDKKAILFNCNSNYTVQTFVTPSPLWSCCWNSVNQNIFYVGSTGGQVTSYDIRAPQEPLSTLSIPTTEKSGVVRLKFVPPAYQSQSFNMSGLLIQKLGSVWFCEMHTGRESDPRYHQLPMEGPFLNVDFEAGSRHVLVSTRPKQQGGQRVPTSHVVCNLGKTYSEPEERDIFSCDIVQVMNGGFQEAAIMCRSAFISPQQGQVYVAANGETSKTVRVWDVANVDQKTLIHLDQDAALDFVHGSINETRFLGVIMDKGLEVFDVK